MAKGTGKGMKRGAGRGTGKGVEMGAVKDMERGRNAHMPRLDTVLMVEETMKGLGSCTMTELYRALPRAVVYPTLRLIVSYFQSRGFISVRDNRMEWAYGPAPAAGAHRARPEHGVW